MQTLCRQGKSSWDIYSPEKGRAWVLEVSVCLQARAYFSGGHCQSQNTDPSTAGETQLATATVQTGIRSRNSRRTPT